MGDNTVTIRSGRANERNGQFAQHAIRQASGALLVGAICFLSTEIGFASRVPPHNISVLWPTNAILFAVLVLTPIRNWWLYAIAAYFTSVFIHDAAAGFPLWSVIFLAAALVEAFIAAAGVRRFAGGVRAFDSVRTLVAYIIFAVLLAPGVSATIAGLAAGEQGYWYFWRVWFLAQSLAYLTIAPVILNGINRARAGSKAYPSSSNPKIFIETGLLGLGSIAVCIGVFALGRQGHGSIPALVYLPLPFLLWAAVRFGPLGVSASLLVLTLVSILCTIAGRGPFATVDPAENVISLQLFLLAVSLPLYFLSALTVERREKMNVLAESEARFRSMADTAPVLIWMSEVEGTRTFFSRPWLAFAGQSHEHQSGNGWLRGIHPDDLEPTTEIISASFHRRREFEIEYRLRRHDGQYRWVLDKGIPRYAQGTFVGYIGTTQDVSDQKKAELAAQEHRAELAHVTRVATMGQLTASLAHELNQPLGSILINAEAARCLLAAKQTDLNEVGEIIEDIRSIATRAGQIISGLHGLARKSRPSPALFDLGDAIREVAVLARSDAIRHSCRISIDIAPGLPAIHADRTQMQQVVLNLLVNALDAVGQSRATDRTIVLKADVDPQGVRVSVRDHGPGLSAENLARIFQPFFTTKQKGLGMGLSISRAIVSAAGGRLWAENNEDKGATFVFTIPFGRQE